MVSDPLLPRAPPLTPYGVRAYVRSEVAGAAIASPDMESPHSVGSGRAPTRKMEVGMAWFDPREYGRAPSSRSGKLLVLGASIAILVGLSVLVTGGFAQSRNNRRASSLRRRSRARRRVSAEARHQALAGRPERLEGQCAKGQKPLKLALWPAKRSQPESKAPRDRQDRRDPPERRGTSRSAGSRWRCRADA